MKSNPWNDRPMAKLERLKLFLHEPSLYKRVTYMDKITIKASI